VTSPERQASGVGMIVIESSDLGRKGREGATVVIFTAGMDDLRGQVFDFENDCHSAILTVSTLSKGDPSITKKRTTERTTKYLHQQEHTPIVKSVVGS